MVKADRADTTRQRLLAAARAVVVQRGWSAATTRAIAGEAGVNLALVNYHFGSKAKLLEAMVEQCVTSLQEAAGPSPGDPAIMLSRWIRGVDRLVDEPEARALLEAIFAAVHDPALVPLMCSQLERLRAALAEALRAQGFRGRRARGLTHGLAALFDGLLLHRAIGAELDARAVADAVVYLLRSAAP